MMKASKKLGSSDNWFKNHCIRIVKVTYFLRINLNKDNTVAAKIQIGLSDQA